MADNISKPKWAVKYVFLLTLCMIMLSFSVSVIASDQSILFENTKGYWNMNQPSFPLTSIRNGYEIISTGGNAPSFGQAGIIDTCPYFDDSNNEEGLFSREGSDNPIINLGQNQKDFTIHVWIKPDDDTKSQMYIFGEGHHGSPAQLKYTDGNEIDLYLYNSVSIICDIRSINANVKIDTWTMVDVMRRNGIPEIWINGTNLTSAQIDSVNLVNCENFYFHNYSYSYEIGMLADDTNDDRHFSGYIDEFATFGVALNQSQISYLWNSGSPTTAQQYPYGYCTPVWSCSGYGSCNTSDLSPCDSVTDANNCSEAYSGDYSEFTAQSCNYCSADEEITNTSACVTHQQYIYVKDNNFATCCDVTGLVSDCLYGNQSTDSYPQSCGQLDYSENDLSPATISTFGKFLITIGQYIAVMVIFVLLAYGLQNVDKLFRRKK